MLLSYTWSHSMDDYSGSDVSDVTLLPGDMVNEKHNYGSSDFDRRHRFVGSYLYNLPDAYHGGSAFAKKLVTLERVGNRNLAIRHSVLYLRLGFRVRGNPSQLAPGRTVNPLSKAATWPTA